MTDQDMRNDRCGFGFWPSDWGLTIAGVRFLPVDNHEEIMGWFQSHQDFERGVYIPRPVYVGASCQPLFGLPRSHEAESGARVDEKLLRFVVQGLSFFTGSDLTELPRGRLGFARIIPGGSIRHQMSFDREALEFAVLSLERLWHSVGSKDAFVWMEAAMHNIAQAADPRMLEYERFLYLYAAGEALYKAGRDILKVSSSYKKHTTGGRIEALATELKLKSVPSKSLDRARIMRNEMLHECSIHGKPWGYALLHAGGGRGDLSGITNLLSRLLSRATMALLGHADTSYVRSSVQSRGLHGVRLAESRDSLI